MIAQSIAYAHSGRITVETVVEQGGSFKVIIPGTKPVPWVARSHRLSDPTRGGVDTIITYQKEQNSTLGVTAVRRPTIFIITILFCIFTIAMVMLIERGFQAIALHLGG